MLTNPNKHRVNYNKALIISGFVAFIQFCV